MLAGVRAQLEKIQNGDPVLKERQAIAVAAARRRTGAVGARSTAQLEALDDASPQRSLAESMSRPRCTMPDYRRFAWRATRPMP